MQTAGNGNLDTRQYEDDIQNSDRIGLVTMLFLHRVPNVQNGRDKYKDWEISLYFVLLLLIQLATPGILFWTQLHAYLELDIDRNYCPHGRASWSTRLLAFFVGGIYFSRVVFRLRAKFEEDAVDRVIPQKGANGGVLQLYYIEADRNMDTTYEAFVYLLNLAVVFMSFDPLDVVINALAMEFILDLDDALMVNYWKMFPPQNNTRLVQAFIAANNGGVGPPQNPIAVWQLQLTHVLKFLRKYFSLFPIFALLLQCFTYPDASHESQTRPNVGYY